VIEFKHSQRTTGAEIPRDASGNWAGRLNASLTAGKDGTSFVLIVRAYTGEPVEQKRQLSEGVD
jgi:hypothetical protein